MREKRIQIEKSGFEPIESVSNFESSARTVLKGGVSEDKSVYLSLLLDLSGVLRHYESVILNSITHGVKAE